MKLVRGAWKLLVGIKDGLVLILMLLFFGALFAALSAKPNTRITDGALVLDLAGSIVEQPAEADPVALLSGQPAAQELRLRDVVRALDAARTDSRVKAVVLDMDRFTGGYPAALAEVGDAVARVRASNKPVLAYATLYTDGAYRIASNASEVWENPFGGTMFRGPGGAQLYYKGLIDKLGVNAHVYRVGQFKSAVEPFTRADQSEPARAANQALYGAIFDQWRAAVQKARPKAQLDAFLTRPDAVIQAAGGDIAQANLRGGIVDKLGDRLAFGKRVAELAGEDKGKAAGSFRTIKYASWLAANPAPTSGDAIGVITVAGTIVDGEAKPGTAGGDTIAKLLLDGLATKNLKALVVRVDSPGGSVLASERIRQAILQAKAAKLPVVVSMGGLAASGGYWVSTPGDVIFAEPNTITGSIGVFGVIPTFENTLSKIGVTADGVGTTPLSGQPDVLRGTNPAFDTIMQSGVEHIYARFTGMVAQSRGLPQARVDQIGQGRVWDGGTARQLKLVDRFGNLTDAVGEAARRAGLDPAKVQTVYLEKEPSPLEKALKGFADRQRGDAPDQAATDLLGRVAIEQRSVLAQALGDARRMLTAPAGVQARCLECGGLGPVRASAEDASLFDLIVARWFA
ncbi:MULTISPECIES: signal peptide peptidase SppA [Sphingomonas]|uniref:Signal peptide peptidase SppA n=1 Tax=Sphingomonas hankookensis TaxID=563996 RepID=A0ABR5YB92_9SPHN|nr:MULTISPECIES: signal peptide peptidase SppA [Sphingomonas]KZE11627.1 signal peptide peptidase SppA [Sphingomonas hankookensis]PZT94354.1 MAG: signal peptide peptidase SppA [Sphingomonas sp.]RSV33150.1 signal peptide peptidase SppA [Sphingomonas sp. ABOLH]WCP72372.1 signal peptide peptidase SppA [Sphingomonas hankookensis]